MEYLLFVLLLPYSSSCSIVVVNVVSFLPTSTYLVPFSHSFGAPHTPFTFSFYSYKVMNLFLPDLCSEKTYLT